MKLVNIEDLRSAAKRRLPRIFFDYLDGGALDEATLRANRADFDAYRLEQRVLTGHSEIDLSTDFLGTRHALPFMLGPIGFLGLFAGGGEIKAAKAAHAAGIPICISTFSIASVGSVCRETTGPLHFQLYLQKDRALSEEVLHAAREAGVETLFLTVDTAVTGIRERDIRNGFRAATRLTLRMFADMVRRPAWCVDMLRSGLPSVGMVSSRPEFGRGVLEQAGNLSRSIDPAVSWKDVDWLRSRWKGRLVIKGVLSAADAKAAHAAGADGVVVSNHGGRQLDGASSTIAVLDEVRGAVQDDIEVLIDGGIRRGTDIVKCLALGASGVLLGRAYAYGLAAAGQNGVSLAIVILKEELAATVALMGLGSIDELKRSGPTTLRGSDQGL